MTNQEKEIDLKEFKGNYLLWFSLTKFFSILGFCLILLTATVCYKIIKTDVSPDQISHLISSIAHLVDEMTPWDAKAEADSLCPEKKPLN